ncbi:hypothetical protein Bca4012_024692 [Brassica carinata]
MQRLSSKSNPNFRERKSPILIGGTMDEGDTSEFYSGKETFVFWNFDDYPVPVDTDLGSICSNIEHALRLMGFDGYASINVDCKKLNSNEEALYKAKKIFYLPYCTEGYRKSGVVPTLDMTFYMIYTIQETAPERSNVAVIVKPNIDPNSELHRILHCLKSRGHNVLLIEQPPDGECLFSVDSLLKNSRLLGGGKPRVKKEFTPDELRRLYEEEEEEEEVDGSDDVSNLSNKMMLDFSVRTKHVKGDRTVIFWDAIDCPFPLCFSPDQIFEKIKSPLLKNGLSDNITIWAYVDERSWRDKYLGNKTWHSRIYFLPAGDRLVRMLNDMYLDSRDSPLRYCRGSLILVSDHFSGDPYYLELFRRMKYLYHLIWLVPSDHSNISETPDEWPRSLFDRDRKSAEGPLPKKPKLDAA